jgi:hypothetical protein
MLEFKPQFHQKKKKSTHARGKRENDGEGKFN